MVETISDPKHPNYANYLSTEEIGRLVASDPKHVKAVTSWLDGVDGLAYAVLSDCIRVKGTVAAVEKLMGATLHTYLHVQSGRKAVRLFGQAHLPDHLREAVEFISGLSDFPIVRKPRLAAASRTAAAARGDASVTITKSAGGSDDPDYYIWPGALLNLYGVPANNSYPTAKNSMGVIEFGGNAAGYEPADLTNFFTQIAGAGQPPAPVTFGTFTPGGDPNLDTECTLDIEYIQGLSTNVTTWFWTIDNGWVYEMANSLAEAKKFPLVVSVSYGWGESEQCDVSPCSVGEDSKAYVARSNKELAKLAAKGISVLVSSGDTGAQGLGDADSQTCSNTKVPPFNADYPSNSPYVTGVGATMLMGDSSQTGGSPYCGDGSSQFSPCSAGTGYEVACSYPRAKITGGGGISLFQDRPSWQESAVSSYLKNSSNNIPPSSYFKATGRGNPDVAYNGHNYLIYDTNEGGQAPSVFPVDGTSASAPGFAGLVSLLNGYQLTATGKPLGFLNPLFYQNAEVFTDITEGNNKCTEQACCQYGWSASTGWDPVTGLGTPNYPKMLQMLKNVNQRRGFKAI
jgi:tripeptidyl-peptidase-1